MKNYSAMGVQPNLAIMTPKEQKLTTENKQMKTILESLTGMVTR